MAPLIAQTATGRFIMIVLGLLINLALLVMILTCMSNFIFLQRLKSSPHSNQSTAPLVSILIPARNEATVIHETVTRLLNQAYTNFEVIVLNDHSSDGTGRILAELAKVDSRLQVYDGVDLPEGWTGKSWACEQLGQYANGDILIFTDADVRWEPTALSAIVNEMHDKNVGMLTVWSTQITETWAERFVVPLIGLAIMGYLPSILVHHTPFSAFSAANGQCMAWTREAYRKLGGHRVVSQTVLDDVTLAREAKSIGIPIRMMDGNHLIACRMYDSWASVRDGFAKNILAGHGNQVWFLLVSTVFHVSVFVLPWLFLFMDEMRIFGLSAILFAFALRATIAIYTNQRVVDILSTPIAVLMMCRIALRSIIWHFGGGPKWKGRTLTPQKQRRQAS